MSAATINLEIEKGTLKLTNELLFARVRIDTRHEEHESSTHSAPPKHAPSWLVVEFLSETTLATISALDDGSYRFRLQIAKDDQELRDRLVRQIISKRRLKLRGVEERCDWIDE